MSPRSDVAARMIAPLGRFVAGASTVEGTLHDAVETAVDAVDAAAMGGVTLVDDRGAPKTRASTSPRAQRIDEAQYVDDVGPCLDAWRQRRIVHVGDVRDVEVEYPRYASTAEGLRVRSTLSLPLVVGDSAIGALNLYAEDAHVFDEGAARIASDVCTVIASVMAIVARYDEVVEANDQLRHAMESRATIEQAKGIVMATMRCSADDAFDILRQQSQNENRKLRDIAAELVDRHVRH